MANKIEKNAGNTASSNSVCPIHRQHTRTAIELTMWNYRRAAATSNALWEIPTKSHQCIGVDSGLLARLYQFDTVVPWNMSLAWDFLYFHEIDSCKSFCSATDNKHPKHQTESIKSVAIVECERFEQTPKFKRSVKKTFFIKLWHAERRNNKPK